jgi:small subunit ribosomal protein S16
LLKIRLSRIGKKRQPSFRLVVQEHSNAVKGKFIEKLGTYRPTVSPKEFIVDAERVKYWLSQGAQPSDSVAVLLKNEGLEKMEKYIAPRDKKKKKKKEVEPTVASEASDNSEDKKEEKAETPAPAPTEEPKEESKKEETPAEEKPAEEPAPAEEAPKEEEKPEEDSK